MQIKIFTRYHSSTYRLPVYTNTGKTQNWQGFDKFTLIYNYNK